MSAYTEEGLLAEFAALQERVPEILARVRGRLFFETRRYANEQARNHSTLQWINLAHRGTLGKIPDMLPAPGPHGTMELLATARNVFENQVWIRLMAKETGFGLVFYAHLLGGQIQHCKSYIDKLTDDASLFDIASELDESSTSEAVAAFKDMARQDAVGKNVMYDLLHSRTDMLDEMMRGEFALYSDDAVTRGYTLQAFMMRDKEIPRFQAQLAIIESHQTALRAALPSLLSPTLQTIAMAKWNWAERAKDVSMEKHYRFIYSLTSRLLHSTPVNIITDKDLKDNERILVLNYIVVACRDIFKIVEEFTYPGMAHMALIQAE